MAYVIKESHLPVTRSELPWAVRTGAMGGIVAAVVFAAFEMMASAAMMGMEAFFMPLRMIGAILLGPVALDPGYSLWAAGLAGLMVHMTLAIIYGIAFAIVVGGLRSATADVALGTIYGFALWLFNFYVIAPAAFPWFLMSSPVVQFIGHSFFFGTVLGWYVWWARQRTAETGGAG